MEVKVVGSENKVQRWCWWQWHDCAISCGSHNSGGGSGGSI